MKNTTYERPSLTTFGNFRQITLSGYGFRSDGGCLLGCNYTGQLECEPTGSRS